MPTFSLELVSSTLKGEKIYKAINKEMWRQDIGFLKKFFAWFWMPRICACGGVLEQRLAGKMPTHRSGMPRICSSIPLQDLQDPGHHRSLPSKGHLIGHRRSRSCIEVAVDQEGRGVAHRVSATWTQAGAWSTTGWVTWGRGFDCIKTQNPPWSQVTSHYITDEVSRYLELFYWNHQWLPGTIWLTTKYRLMTAGETVDSPERQHRGSEG